MSQQSQESLVGGQFGSRAEAYLTSAVHSKSADLDALVALMDGKSDARVLDLGCGGGHVTFNVAKSVREVIAYDLSAEMLEVVWRTAGERGLDNVATKQGFAEQLPFEDASFDAVLSRFSAHHWTDMRAGVREAARVLRPGGMFALVDAVAAGVPVVDTFLQTIEMLRDCSHVRDYSRAEWEAAIGAAGLRQEAVSQTRMRLDFASWVERMNTPKVQVEAIRALQKSVSAQTTAWFDTEADGSFFLDVAMFTATKPG